MSGWTFFAALAIWPLSSAHAQPACETITDGIEYCTEADRSRGFISAVIYPDHVATYRLSRNPLISSHIVVMPLDRTLTGASDVVDMVFDQLSRGTPPFNEVIDIQTRNGLIDGRDTIQVEFRGLSRHGDPRGAYVVEALPGSEAVLLIYTGQERAAKEEDGRPGPAIKAVTQELREAHNAALADYRIGR